VNPRTALKGQKIRIDFEVRSDYSFPHPFYIKVVRKDGTELAHKSLGVINPNQVVKNSIEFKAETDEEILRFEVSVWVQIEALQLLDGLANFEIPIKHKRGILGWLLRR